MERERNMLVVILVPTIKMDAHNECFVASEKNRGDVNKHQTDINNKRPVCISRKFRLLNIRNVCALNNQLRQSRKHRCRQSGERLKQ